MQATLWLNTYYTSSGTSEIKPTFTSCEERLHSLEQNICLYVPEPPRWDVPEKGVSLFFKTSTVHSYRDRATEEGKKRPKQYVGMTHGMSPWEKRAVFQTDTYVSYELHPTRSCWAQGPTVLVLEFHVGRPTDVP